MNKFKVLILDQEEFTIESTIQIYEGDCFINKNKTYYTYKRVGNNLFVKPVNRTVNI